MRARLNKKDRFTPDMFVKDGDDLSEFGFDAMILHTPGHSSGSIVILTEAGDLLCGDLLTNNKRPAKNSVIGDHIAFDNSIEKLKRLKANTVYPGHGKPFPMQQFMKNLKQ